MRTSPRYALLALGCLLCLPCCVRQTVGSDLRQTAIVKAVKRARPSVVNIRGEKLLPADSVGYPAAESERRVNGMGTGVVIDERGYIITNLHVVDGVRQIKVSMWDGTTHTARLISQDGKTDLAIIKIDVEEDLPLIPIGTSRDLMHGEPVIAIGNAYGYEHTVTRGIISALHRTVQVGDAQEYVDLIQTDASINPGNSGGPLLNIDGELIGINVAVRVGAQNIGFAIPVDRAINVATELMSANRIDRIWHGLALEPGDSSSEPAMVQSVSKTSPAARCGVQPGDIIRSVAGRKVQRPLDVERALLGRRPGEEVEVTLLRDHQSVEIKLVLAAAPQGNSDDDELSWTNLGLRLEPVPKSQFQRYGTRYRGGLRVTAVRTDSAAWKNGIRRGDVLLGIHEWETVSLENVTYILKSGDLDQSRPTKFYILRDKEILYGYLPIGTMR